MLTGLLYPFQDGDTPSHPALRGGSHIASEEYYLSYIRRVAINIQGEVSQSIES